VAGDERPGIGLGGGERASRVVLLGPPNSGKGTQALVLGRRLGVPAISTGEMLRAAVAEGSELGARVDGIMKAGELVDDATMADVVRERLAKPDARPGFILDGYPRTVPQAETLVAILAASGRELDAAVLIRVPEEALVARALGRGRTDDREEVLRERFRVYGEKTAPLIGYYRQLGLLREVEGDLPVAEVTSRLAAVLAGAAAGRTANTSEG
jgi:adenylate kinase